MKTSRLVPIAARALFLGGVLAGCKVEPPKPPLVETVAVLPFDNESNDLNAPDVLQDYVYRALLNSPYRPLDIKLVNDRLASVGIVDGGQLAAVDPVKLGKDLGVHALLFGNVETFGYTNVGYYTSRKVTIELRMVDVQTGATLWEASGTGANRNFTLDSAEAKKNLVEGIAQQAADKLTKTVLDAESREAVEESLESLPGFRFAGFQGAPEKPAIKIGDSDSPSTTTFIRKKKK